MFVEKEIELCKSHGATHKMNDNEVMMHSVDSLAALVV